MSNPKNLDRRAIVTALTAGAAVTGLAAAARAAETVVPAATTTATAAGAPGTVWWTEYMAQDTARMNQFYANVIGWRMKLVSFDDNERLAQPGEKAYMMMLSTAGEEAAGVMRLADAGYEGARAGWFTYINVEDADAAAKRCAQNGGKVLVQPFDSDENVRISVIQDPEGATLGLVSKRAV
jgi:hypothetical protein